MKSIEMYLSICLSIILIIGCGNDPKDDPTPTPPNPAPIPTAPIDTTIISIGTLPDSVKVETAVNVKFTVLQQNHSEDFKISVDTVMPYFYSQVSFDGTTHKRIYLEQDKILGKADITINRKKLKDLTSIQPGKENIISFSNPTAVGTYKIILSIIDKYNRKTQKEIGLRVWSPEIIVKFYNYFPGYDENSYYESLNSKFAYNPLSDGLKGKRVDTIYTKEEPMHGHPGEWTVPGQGIVCYIGQEGGKDFYYTTAYNYEKSTTSWAARWDGDVNAHQKRQKVGFHGIMFETATNTTVGVEYFTIYLIDHWGKEISADIPYKAFGRDEAIPSHCTPSENSWWAHYITD